MYEKSSRAMSVQIDTYLQSHPNAGLVFDGEEIAEGERITRQIELAQLLEDASDGSGIDRASRLLRLLSTHPKNLFLAFNLCKAVSDGVSLEITVDECAAVKNAAIQLGTFFIMKKYKLEMITKVQIIEYV